jgi:HEPN domain-containing protein
MNETVREWHEKATNDFDSMMDVSHGVRANYDLVCFLAQQGVEKLIKGALIARGILPPKIHNLVELHLMLKQAVPEWEWSIQELERLSSGAVIYRYPGETASAESAEKAIDSARRLREALLPLLEVAS